MDGEDIDIGEQSPEAVPEGCVEFLGEGCGDGSSVVVVDFESEAGAVFCDSFADSSKSEDTESFSAETLSKEGSRAPSCPEAGAEEFFGFAHSVRDGEHKPDGDFGGICGIYAWRIGDVDIAGTGGGEIDVIDAGAEVGDEFEFGTCGFEGVGVELVAESCDDDIGAREGIFEFLGLGGEVGVVEFAVE